MAEGPKNVVNFARPRGGSRERIGLYREVILRVVAKSFVPAKSIGAITPRHPQRFNLNIHNPLRISSRDEELVGETRENTVKK